VKVLIQNPVTLEYFHSPLSWSSAADDAMAFEDSHSAVQFCLEHGLAAMNVVLKFDDGQYDLQVPVLAADSHIAHSEVAV
jgi:hypothetical protein